MSKFKYVLSVSLLLSCFGTASVASDNTGWSGVVEVETGAIVADSSLSESDIVLATVELGYEHFITKNASISVLLLHEDDDTEPAEIDHATINLINVGGLNFNLGRQYMPFGSYNSGMVSDPLTLEIGETREVAFGVSKSINLLSVEAYMFQGDAQPTTDAWIPDVTVKISFADEGDISYAFDAYYISQLATSEILTNAITSSGALSHSVGGVGISGQLAVGSLVFDAECLSAVKAYSDSDFNGNKPMACHFEIGANATLATKETSFAIGYDMTNDALDLELPKSRIGASASVLLSDNLAVSLEWLMASGYGVSDGGSGENSQVVTAQVAMEF